MTDNFNSMYRYDRCASRGICSINPTTSSLQEVILIFIKQMAFYELNLRKNNIFDENIRNFVLNTVSILSSNYEISEHNFRNICTAFKKELPKIKEKYKAFDNTNKFKSYDVLIENCDNINKLIRFGEKEFNKRIQAYSSRIRCLYKILFIIIKSLCINILTLESFGVKADSEYIVVIKTFNLLNFSNIKESKLIKTIQEISKKDCSLMKEIRKQQEIYYGKQRSQEVSFSTRKGKCILVVGSNLRELELILEKSKDSNVDIYTHDNMILAHTFPKFLEYKNLIGQYGQGIENCLLDFSTFPGPIILTRHSLFNIENLYRGLLYTTDIAYQKGVIPIINDDFSAVINAATEAKGFKTGRKCQSEKFGFDFIQTVQDIKNRVAERNFKRIFIWGLPDYSNEEKEYLKIFLKKIPEDVLVISFSCCPKNENIISLNIASDIFTMLKLVEELITNLSTSFSLFIPFCSRHIISLLIYIHSLKNIDIFVGLWNQTVLNPTIMDCLTDSFNFNEITYPKNDLSKIFQAG